MAPSAGTRIGVYEIVSLISNGERRRRARAEVQTIGAPPRIRADRGKIRLNVTLPRQGMALFRVAY